MWICKVTNWTDAIHLLECFFWINAKRAVNDISCDWLYTCYPRAPPCLSNTSHWLVFCRFYKGIVPLWGRQIPYTMMKFACFERTVEALYMYAVPKPRAECSKGEQLMVTFVAGYIGKYSWWRLDTMHSCLYQGVCRILIWILHF